MLVYLILLFTLVPAIELALLIKIGQHIGVINTLTVIILTGVLGAYLARLQGFLVLARIQKNINNGVLPTEEMLDGLMILCGGLVLLTPGFITDIFGFLILIPYTRTLIMKLVKNKIQSMVAQRQILEVRPFRSENDDSD